MRYDPVRGTYDVLPDTAGWWQVVEAAVRDVARRYNYREIRTPILEHTELFSRGIGESTDVVNKEMYTFQDRRGRSLTLRPEGTASVARAYLSHGLQTEAPFQKLFYVGPMFRYEKPQKGRFRQFEQYGVEAIGSLDPSLDAEVIAFAWTLMDDLGLGGLWLRLNSIGCAEDRDRYRDILRRHFADRLDRMCSDCQRRHEMNPLRILDCKEDRCRPHIDAAPGSAEHLCSECADHFAQVRTLLDELGLSYEIDPRVVRGLDYYTRTVFELVSSDLGSQDSLLGGGRYDGLIEALGGPPTPGVGFAGGTERLVIVLRERGSRVPSASTIDLFLATLGGAGRRIAFRLAEALRRQGIAVDIDHRDRSLRKQLTLANQLAARFLLVIGDDEAASGRGALKEMATGEEVSVDLAPETIVRAVERPGSSD